MLSVFLTVLPVFLILAAGYLIGRFQYLPDNVADALNGYAVKFAVPVLLFMAMHDLDFSKAFHPKMLISFYSGAIICFLLAMVSARLIWQRRPGEAVVVGFCAFFSNTVLIGIPVAQLAFGDEILTPVFGVIAFHASSLYTIGMVTMEFSRQDGRPFLDTIKAALVSVIANPLMLGILAGLAFNFSGFEKFGPLEQSLDMIRASAIPVALVGIGIVLNRYKINSAVTETLTVSCLALILHPLIAFLLGYYVFGLELLLLKAIVVLAAMPPGMNIYVFANMYKRAEGLAASTLVIATILSVFTITAWLLFLQKL